MRVENNMDSDLISSRLADGYSYWLCGGVKGSIDLVRVTDVGLVAGLPACLFVKTSGSSGSAKWVVLSKEGLLEHARRVNGHLCISGDDVFGLVLPLCHVGGLGVVLRALVGGAGLVRYSGKWSASGCLGFIERGGVSVISMVPTQVVDLVDEGLISPACLRLVVVGGGGLPGDVRARALELGWPIRESYGMTETGSQIATCVLAADGGGAGAMPVMGGWDLRLSDEGYLEVRGDCLFEGYLCEVDGGFEFVDPKVEGWYRTSDKVGLEVCGGVTWLSFIGRGDMMVKILGELVDLGVLEAELAVVVGGVVYVVPLADERRGVRLYPVVSDARMAGEVGGLCWGGLRRLEDAVVVDVFPVNEMGKLQRGKLMEVVESIVFSAE